MFIFLLEKREMPMFKRHIHVDSSLRFEHPDYFGCGFLVLNVLQDLG